MRRILTLVLLLAACAGGAVYAGPESNNALALNADGAVNVAFTGRARQDFCVTNDGANPAHVYVWDGGQTVAAITAATSGVRKVNPSEGFCWRWDGNQDGGIGYTSFSYIRDAGLATTLRWYAK
jgi:hypothetical protein